MRTITRLLLVLALASPAVVTAQSVPLTELNARPPASSGISFEALSDTKGTQLNLYLGSLARNLREALRNDSVASRAEVGTPGPVDLVLTIDGQGKLVALHLESADTPMSKAVWKAATKITYAPLPDRLRDTSLRLKVHVAAL